ncbi:ABATE domain-containing protein [Marinactinospora thermotolerans]|uniref:Putative stress-induced transcription regulator n=1 Tax=Marinactinospora thermotolerans DSM 45154 TaxID=1122192 RepID=A0A1T4T6K5_9ACTN|nr:ABATE domain-containing protein [Marinactinospora thermotolerans]SKA36043.1 Putative stress-induced transcription regulator [Marinactinospora thermotolerans DSM 45154]
MTTPTDTSAAAALIRAFVLSGDSLSDRAGLAAFLRKHRLVTEGAIPITLADHSEAVTLRDGLYAHLRHAAGGQPDPETVARAQRVLDGLRVTVRLAPGEAALSPLAPAVVDEVRRGLARIAGAWAAVVATGEWRAILP